MSSRDQRIETVVEAFRGQELDPHYLAFFQCFNQEQFFEAHEVLETLWLKERGRPKAAFYKGLIQLAGAFVHLQKNRTKPAAALFRLAEQNLGSYPPFYDGLKVDQVRQLSAECRRRLETNLGPPECLPKLRLQTEPSPDP